MNLSMTIIRAVAKELDRDTVYDRAQALGAKAASLRRAQISGLESIANSTRKVSDVLDYLKLRTARHKEWRVDNIGADVLGFLQQELRKSRDGVFKELTDMIEKEKEAQKAGDQFKEYVRQDIYIRLIRGFVAQLAAQYEYAVLQQGKAGQDDPDDAD